MSAATLSAAPAATAYRLRWWVFAVVLAADVMDLLDSTIVNIAGPSVRADLGGGAATLQWLSAAYTLTFAVFLVTGARLGDILGRRRLFLIGSAGFTLASTACAVAPSPAFLIAMRVLQGAFGAVMLPQGFGMLKEVIPDEEMPKVFGLFGPVMGLSAVGGPILAGLLVDADLWGTGWRLVFLINLPIGLATLAAAIRCLPRTIAAPGTRLDVGGMALVGAAAFALIYPLIEGREQGWPWWCFAMLAAGVALTGAFLAYTRRRREAPLIELSLLENRAFTTGIALALVFFASFGGVLLVLSLFCQLGEGYSPIRTGIALAPVSLGMVAAMPISFALIEKVGRRLIHVGIAISAVGMVVLAAMVAGHTSLSAWTLTPGLVIAGFGTGLVFGQLFDVILAGVDARETGSASGVLNAIQQLAFAIGVAGVGTLFFSLLEGHHLPSDALSTTALLTVVPLAGAFALAFRLPPRVRAES